MLQKAECCSREEIVHERERETEFVCVNDNKHWVRERDAMLLLVVVCVKETACTSMREREKERKDVERKVCFCVVMISSQREREKSEREYACCEGGKEAREILLVLPSIALQKQKSLLYVVEERRK